MNNGRMIFKSPDEMMKFLRDLRDLFSETAAEPEEEAEELTDTNHDSAASSADNADKTPLPAVYARLDIPEGVPAAYGIISSLKELYGDDIVVSFAKPEVPSTYYDAERRIYYYDGQPYGEGAIIWFSIVQGACVDISLSYDAELDQDRIIMPLEVNRLNRHHPRIPLETDYQAAFDLAKTKDQPGLVGICRGGKIYIPCVGFYNYADSQPEYLITIFNAKACDPYSTHLWMNLVINIGNISDVLPFKYARGTEIDWEEAIYSILTKYNQDIEDVLRPVELFDETNNGFVKKEPRTKPDSGIKTKKSPSNPKRHRASDSSDQSSQSSQTGS